MTTRDELAASLIHNFPDWIKVDRTLTATNLANVMAAEGWRKMPSKEQIEAHLEAEEFHWSQPWKGDVLDAILALMDGDNE